MGAWLGDLIEQADRVIGPEEPSGEVAELATEAAAALHEAKQGRAQLEREAADLRLETGIPERAARLGERIKGTVFAYVTAASLGEIAALTAVVSHTSTTFTFVVTVASLGSMVLLFAGSFSARFRFPP